MAQNINVRIQIRKIANGYVVSGTGIAEMHDGPETEIHVGTVTEAEELAQTAFTNEIAKLD